jgi:hypothetical protein
MRPTAKTSALPVRSDGVTAARSANAPVVGADALIPNGSANFARDLISSCRAKLCGQKCPPFTAGKLFATVRRGVDQ